ncbi:hypothetical protein Hanom_Chr05g00391281 [Helianthus anomalus]
MESRNKTSKKEVETSIQITRIPTMLARIQEQNTEKENSDLIQNTSFLNPQEDPYNTPAKPVPEEQPASDINKI